MKKSEFIALVREAERWQRRYSLIFLASFFGTLGALAGVERWQKQGSGPP